MANTKRRSVIKLAGSAAAVASTGMAGILASGRTPAYAQTKTVHWLRWVDFVPASDQLMRKELMPEAEKALGIKICPSSDKLLRIESIWKRGSSASAD